jgi:glycosyl transferase family 25
LRREFVSKQLLELGLDFEIIDAVDGATLDAATIEDIYDPELAIETIYRELNRAEIGCYLSHVHVYRRMIEQDIKEVIVLEDDAELLPGFPELIEARQQFPEHGELTLLHHHGAKKYLWWKQKIDDRYRLVRFVTPAMGAVAYLIRQSAARKILSIAFPIRMPIDHMTGGDGRTGVALYGVEPPCIGHAVELQLDNTIQGRDELWAKYDHLDYGRNKYWNLLYTFLINIHVRFWPKYIK